MDSTAIKSLEWNKTKLSLERPYKNDEGQLIPTLLDITPDGQFIYESREEQDAKIGELFRRILIERGVDFFDKDPSERYGASRDEDEGQPSTDNQAKKDPPDTGESGQDDEDVRPMTPEMLLKMRGELIPRLQYVRT
jgi:mediator of RNA polymerase II transcription subunit 17, fungi type